MYLVLSKSQPLASPVFTCTVPVFRVKDEDDAREKFGNESDLRSVYTGVYCRDNSMQVCRA